MNHIWDLIGRLVTWFWWSPLDRTVCAWSNLTHRGMR